MTHLNADVKAQALLNGVRLYEIAQHCKIGESTFHRKMRVELSQADRERFLRAIKEIAREKKETRLDITSVTPPDE